MSAPESAREAGYPLIVMGMHRSGTSLVARILAAAGVRMGADRNDHAESDFFREANKRLFRAAHADWDWPLAMLPALEDTALVPALVEELREACASREAGRFVGRRWRRADLRALDGPWGWKDPRNTCTLPVWREVFPAARVVNVYRDGVDVAASLVARERKRAGRTANPIRSSRCLDPDRAFELWTEYMEMGLRVTRDLPPTRVRDVRFERLLAKPEETVIELLAFAGVPVAPERAAELAALVEPAQGRRRREELEWAALRRRCADHPLMRRLDYGEAP